MMTNENVNHDQYKGLVSVIIPGYKSSYIRETIDSVLLQTYKNIEIVVVDDGSPNDLRSVLSDYIDTNKIKYIHQHNQKMAAARNNGINNAKGEFIAFIDDDDKWHHDKLEKQMKAFQDESVGLVYTFAEGFNKYGKVRMEDYEKPYNGRVYCDIFLKGFIPNSSVVVRKECFYAVGNFNASPDYYGVDDCDMWTRITYSFDAKVIQEKLTEIRLHDDQFSNNVNIMRDNDLMMREALMNELEVPTYYKRKYYQRFYFDKGYSFRITNKLLSLKFYLKSFRYFPSFKPIIAIVKLPLL